MVSDRGEGVPIFRWDDNYRFGGDDFDDPTTNVHDVAPYQSLNQSPEVTDDAGSTINLTTKVYSCKQSKNEQEYDNAIWILRVYMKYW